MFASQCCIGLASSPNASKVWLFASQRCIGLASSPNACQRFGCLLHNVVLGSQALPMHRRFGCLLHNVVLGLQALPMHVKGLIVCFTMLYWACKLSQCIEGLVVCFTMLYWACKLSQCMSKVWLFASQCCIGLTSSPNASKVWLFASQRCIGLASSPNACQRFGCLLHNVVLGSQALPMHAEGLVVCFTTLYWAHKLSQCMSKVWLFASQCCIGLTSSPNACQRFGCLLHNVVLGSQALPMHAEGLVVCFTMLYWACKLSQCMSKVWLFASQCCIGLTSSPNACRRFDCLLHNVVLGLQALPMHRRFGCLLHNVVLGLQALPMHVKGLIVCFTMLYWAHKLSQCMSKV